MVHTLHAYGVRVERVELRSLSEAFGVVRMQRLRRHSLPESHSVQ